MSRRHPTVRRGGSIRAAPPIRRPRRPCCGAGRSGAAECRGPRAPVAVAWPLSARLPGASGTA